MRIILKHILKNIWEKKGRSLLIILSLIIATTVFVLNLTLPDEIILKIQETLRSMFGKADVSISTVEPFSINDLDIGEEEIDYIGLLRLEIPIKNDKQAIIYGANIENTKKMNMLGEDVPHLNNNEVVINQKQADEYGYKEGDTITFSIEDKEYALKIVKIVGQKGLTSNTRVPIFIANIETIHTIRNIDDETFDELYIDVKNNDNVKSFTEYINNNNENYLVEKLADIEAIKEEISFISYIMILIFAMATIMIFVVVSSLNKVIIAERMPVIGTFRSIGATKGKMNFILILENVVYGIIGGIIGSFVGYAINSKAATLFITADGVDLTNKTSQMTAGIMLIGVIFAVVLEFIISIKAIIKANKKPIKDIIFDVQSTRYVIKKMNVVLGILMFIVALVINYFNKDTQMILTILSIVLSMVGVASLVPMMMRIISKILSTFSRKIGWATGVIASKNIGYNKMIISSSRLIVVAISLMIAILTVSSSFTNLFNSFRYTVADFDIFIEYLTKPVEEYHKLQEIDGVENIEYMYCYGDNHTTYNDGKKFNAIPIILGLNESKIYIKELDYQIKDLKYNEVLIDEKIADKNHIKVDDTLKIKFETLNKELELKIVGFINSAYFTTSRNVILMNLQNFLDNITDVPMQIHIDVKDGIDLEKFKIDIEDNIKEVGVKIQTVEEYISEQEEQTNSIMSLFYIIIGLAVVLSFIGIINNQIISFMQRRKELAVLNSTCMSKWQLKKMLITETILANMVSCLIAIGVGFMITGMIESFMQGLSLYVDMIFDWSVILKFVGIVFIVLLFTLRIPSKRLKKMNIIDEIKYE